MNLFRTVVGGIRVDVRRGRCEWGDMGAEQKHLAIPDNDVAFFQLRATIPQAFHFPAFQRHAGLKAVLDEVIVKCLAILRNFCWWCFFLFLTHYFTLRALRPQSSILLQRATIGQSVATQVNFNPQMDGLECSKITICNHKSRTF